MNEQGRLYHLRELQELFPGQDIEKIWPVVDDQGRRYRSEAHKRRTLDSEADMRSARPASLEQVIAQTKLLLATAQPI